METETVPRAAEGLNIAIVGTGIAGMSAAWLLSKSHHVTIYEKSHRIGGHSNTVTIPSRDGPLDVDMGFIVYNERNYPNLTALFNHLGVPTKVSDMSFSVSLDSGDFEYSGTGLGGLFAQAGNLIRPRFLSMLADTLSFYRNAAKDARQTSSGQTLGDFLRTHGYGDAFVRDHLLPMASAIWSTPIARVTDYPAASFIRFCDNHGLLRLRLRPVWRSVVGGSRAYVERLIAAYRKDIRIGCAVRSVARHDDCVMLRLCSGETVRHDHVVIATHSDEALALLERPSRAEQNILGALRYGENTAVMHTDTTLMPRRRKVWASWNFMGGDPGALPCVTYWMNRLQGLPPDIPVFVTLNPQREPAAGQIIRRETYAHPIFDAASIWAQQQLWSLQGMQRTWYCGAYFGAGFHEDGLQAGLAVAEQLGGVRRPWSVAGESGRIYLTRLAA